MRQYNHQCFTINGAPSLKLPRWVTIALKLAWVIAAVTIRYLAQGRIQNPEKHLRWVFCKYY